MAEFEQANRGEIHLTEARTGDEKAQLVVQGNLKVNLSHTNRDTANNADTASQVSGITLRESIAQFTTAKYRPDLMVHIIPKFTPTEIAESVAIGIVLLGASLFSVRKAKIKGLPSLPDWRESGTSYVGRIPTDHIGT